MSMNETIQATAHSVETLPPLTFLLAPELKKRSAIIQNVEQAAQIKAIASVEPEVTIVEENVEDTDKVQELIDTVTTTSQQQSNKLLQNFNQIGEAVVKTGNLIGVVAGALKFLSVACPHCAVAAVQSVGAVTRSVNFSGIGLGHWHADGTYHEDTHRESTDSEGWFDNPFKWLEVDKTTTKRKMAA